MIIENTDAALKAFTREEIVIMPFWNGRTFVLQNQGVPVDIEYIPGTMLVGNGFPILRGGKFIELTNRFCNMTMNGEYQMTMTKRFFYPPSNRNAKLPPDLAKYAFPADKEKNVVGDRLREDERPQIPIPRPLEQGSAGRLGKLQFTPDACFAAQAGIRC